MTKEEVLQQCKVEGTIIKLPDTQFDRKLYLDVAKALNLIGGKWKGGKVAGFVFQEDPTELLKQIANGEKRNLKKEYQFFATPDELADELVRLADIGERWTNPSFRILEPSAGQGAIIKAIQRRHTDRCPVYAIEKMGINRTILEKMNNVFLNKEPDFILTNTDTGFNRIIANPPFMKNQDIDHIYKMYDVLKEGGRIVSIASNHWTISDRNKETNFREWLEDVGAQIKDIPMGSFKESGTMVGGKIIIIDK